MKRTSIYVLILSAICSCTPEESGPSVFEISPKSLSEETFYAHTAKVSVHCDMDCTASLKQGTWLKVSFAKGESSNSVATLSFSFNDTFSQRKDTLVINCGNVNRTIPVCQTAMNMPGGEFSTSVPGMYLSGGESFRYARLSFQKGRIESGAGKSFRIIETGTRRLLQLSNLPFSYTPGERINFIRYQNAISTMPETSDMTATVLRTEGSAVWLVDDGGNGYIIEK